MTDEKLGRFGHHPEPLIDAEIEAQRMAGLLATARVGLEHALGYRAVTPNGLYIKGCVRDAIKNSDPGQPEWGIPCG
ncbi:MAG: hypothetical protein ACR2RF_26150 [Geminicoccaceae bacterium]